MAKDCIFCQIAKKKVPAKILYESEQVLVFPDINPQAPVHLLIIPKKHIPEFAKIESKEGKILQEMLAVALRLIKEKKLNQKGYRLVLNGGGAALINHLHLHLLGGISEKRSV